MPITAQQAWDATDPSQSQEAREASAAAIMAGVAANDAYLASRSELERLKVLSSGEQVPPSHASLNPDSGEHPTVSDTETETIEGTAEEDTQSHLNAGDTGVGNDATADKLRDQLRAAGLTPEA